MDLRELAVIKMLLEIGDFAKENKEFIDKDPVLRSHFDIFNDLGVNLKTNVNIQETDISGIFTEKSNAKSALAEFIYPVTGGLRSFADDNGDELLFKEFRMPVSRLKHIADIRLVNYSENLSTVCNKKDKLLEPYGITADIRAILEEKTKAYAELMLEPTQLRKGKKLAGKNIRSITSEMLTTLSRKIDNDMLRYFGTELYKQYAMLREIDDSPTRHLPLFGKVKDEETKMALQFVAVTIVRFKTGAELTDNFRSTTKLGNYRFKNIEPDVYKITFSLHAYDTLEMVFALHAGESKRLDVELRKTE